MQKWITLVGAAALALSFGFAPAEAASSKPRSAASIECSKEADAKGLHGKARRSFREKCKRSFRQSRSSR